MAKRDVKKRSSKAKPNARSGARQSRRIGQVSRPAARWTQDGERRLLVLENDRVQVSVWPEMGGAIVAIVDRATGIDIMWRNPYGQPARSRVLDQPMRGGSDLYDVMDGSWYVSLPQGFFAGDYFGAPIGTHLSLIHI